MKNHFFLFLLIQILALSISGCKKQEADHIVAFPAYHYGNSEDYGYFREGTYWIYRDSLTGIEDSEYVYQSNKGTISIEDSGVTRDYIYDDFLVLSTFYNCTFHYNLDESWTIMWGGYPVWRSKYGPIIGTQGETFLCTFPFMLNELRHPYTQSGYVTYTKYFHRLNMNDLWFNDVLVWHDTENSTENDSPTDFYITANIGIIKKVIYNSNHVWELVRYHIEQ